MLKEIVEFSKQLEDAGIYALVNEVERKLDKPVMVIPVNEDMATIKPDDAYFVFKDIIEKDAVENGITIIKQYVTLDGKKGNDISWEIKNTGEHLLTLKKLSDANIEWQEILKSLSLYTKKPSDDPKGNKSIGSNKGTNSYNLLIFEGKFDSGTLSTGRFKGDIFNCKEGFAQKLTNTYRKSNILKGLPEDLDDELKDNYIKLFDSIGSDINVTKIWNKIENLKNILSVFDEKKNEWKFPGNSMFVVFKFQESFYVNYKKWYERYLSKKIFAEDKPERYSKGKCSICNREHVSIYIPNAFHNLDSGKPFLRHCNRYIDYNIEVCETCSLDIYKFQEYFLNKLSITLFPLFIDTKERAAIVNLFKNEGRLEKKGFKEIIQEVYRTSSNEELDFYLIIYNRGENILAFDYITGFKFKMYGENLFTIEGLINRYFFTYQLEKSYFVKDVDTGSPHMNIIIHKYRQPLFDYFYRAKYAGLSQKILADIYFDSLKARLKEFFDKKKDNTKTYYSLKEMSDVYLDLDNIFSKRETKMETVERIKREGKITDKESFAYYAGQIAYYLLNQSKSSEKTHTMIEPFINMQNFALLAERIESLFKAYKHAIPLNVKKFNETFSEMWGFLYDNKEEKFTRDLKTLFYAGYFNSNENIFYAKSKEDKK
ncbi:MAG: hypothetical protein H3C64_06800 [Candidatus Kuenenia stuttgartiensis]|uniref:Uncharacterized protein n=1 Tax=Kuenenia stuttgartiensis TaxID=174633 RepID=Q1Q0Z5_KUEST|nr:hypothetical protein [Candidatus Kuenenia stuttgartiensis]MBE7547788.1 hypothetical protein [Planctomycetia bacterium]MBW7942107.1 hypothetical protein [Candidatus Kuenenia stuttgartiensis]MBZ0191275.1 hypothetical protein [Candidatus Kuenenia stuttgartiensis]CAJ73680.1 hypothetical protein kuste2927 [Candidatus Kuenenia stuttgartiensis]SOH05252.1 hypothetical protein KSMBR1_2765 [Candidatus Kuenenia stuttgartiensis]